MSQLLQKVGDYGRFEYKPSTAIAVNCRDSVATLSRRLLVHFILTHIPRPEYLKVMGRGLYPATN